MNFLTDKYLPLESFILFSASRSHAFVPKVLFCKTCIAWDTGTSIAGCFLRKLRKRSRVNTTLRRSKSCSSVMTLFILVKRVTEWGTQARGSAGGKTYGFISEFVLLSFLPKISSIMLSICVEDSSQVPSLSYKSNTKVSDRRQAKIKNKNIEIRTERNFVTQLIKT